MADVNLRDGRERGMLKFIKTLTRRQKRNVLLLIDLMLVPLAMIAAFGTQADPLTPVETLSLLFPILPYMIVIAAGLAVALRIPQTQLNAYEGRAVTRTGVFSVHLSFALALLAWAFGLAVPPGILVIFGAAFFLFSYASRMLLLWIVTAIYKREIPRRRVLIYGAGTTGTQLAAALRSHEGIDLVAFVDDNTALQGVQIAGLPVYTPARIAQIAEEKRISRVLLAIPSLSQPRQAQIVRRLRSLSARSRWSRN